MDSVDIEVLRSAEAWRKAGHRVTFGTIVKTWGSAPRPVGALVVIRDDGQVVGSVSCGCVEDDLIEKVRSGAVAKELPQLISYGVTNEEATRWALPCGGTLELVLEPVSEKSAFGELLETISKQQLVSRRLEMDSGRVSLKPGTWQDVLAFDGKALVTVHGPRWRLVLIGAGQLTRYLAEMARMLDYHVTVVEPREEYLAGWNVPGIPLDRGMPDDVITAMNLDGHSAVVALTHDPKLDDLALMEALKSAAFSHTTISHPSFFRCDASSCAPGFTTAKMTGIPLLRWRAACTAIGTPCGSAWRSLSEPKRLAEPAASSSPTIFKSGLDFAG